MAEIKSTLEKVMERAATMGQASREEMQAEEQKRRGMRLAADYIQGKDVDFSGAREATAEADRIRQGIVEVFLRNIILPRDEIDRQNVERAMQGLSELAQGSGELTAVFRDMKNVFEHYERQKKEIRQQVEEAFRQQMDQALEQQTGQKGLGVKMDPTLHPKFQEEWAKVKTDINDQYNQVLQQHKDAVAGMFSISL